MAVFNLSIVTDDELGIHRISPSSVTVARGDTLRFTYNPTSGSTSITLSGFSASHVTSTANIVFNTPGQTADKVVRADATLSAFTVTSAALGFANKTSSITVVSGSDTTPDAFSFTNVTLSQPSAVIETDVKTITGINVPTTVSITGGGSFQIGSDQIWRTSGSISNGQKLKLRLTASAAYSATVSTTVTVGTYSTMWQISTAPDPGSGSIIPFPITTGTIKLTDIISFFQGPIGSLGNTNPTTNMRGYLKGAGLVPNIAQNAAIPTSGTLRLSNFRGSATTLYWVRYPGFRGVGADTSAGPKTLTSAWSFYQPVDTKDPIIGFGNILIACEVRYRVTVTSGGPVTCNIAGAVGAWSAWLPAVNGISVSYSAGHNTEAENYGYIDFEVRHAQYPGTVITARANFSLFAFGP